MGAFLFRDSACYNSAIVAGVTGKAWQRPLRNGDVETFVSVEGASVHVFGSVAMTDCVLASFEAMTHEPVPTLQRMRPRFGRPRPQRPLDGQLSIDDALVGVA